VTRFAELLRSLASAQVDFVLVGGVAAAAHGSPRATQDLDIVYCRGAENLNRLVSALGDLNPYLRGAPAGLPFRFDVPTLKAGLNFTLTTDLGWIDLLGEIAGCGRYEDVQSHAIRVEVFGFTCQVLDLETLIHSKRAAGRPKDLEDMAELETIRKRSSAFSQLPRATIPATSVPCDPKN
jgi:predicted nucleotidyltransferase